MPDISTLIVDDLYTPRVVLRPRSTRLWGIAANKNLDHTMFLRLICPALLQEGYIDLIWFNPPGLRYDMAVYWVVYFGFFPGQYTSFAVACDIGEELLDEDTFDARFGGALEVSVHGSDCDSFALKPRYPLSCKDRVEVSAQSVALKEGLS